MDWPARPTRLLISSDPNGDRQWIAHAMMAHDIPNNQVKQDNTFGDDRITFINACAEGDDLPDKFP